VKFRTATLVSQGPSRYEGVTGSGRQIVFGDAPEKNEYSPVESVVVSLAACSAMDVESILSKKRQVVSSYVIEVSAEQRSEYPQVLTRVDVLHIVEGPVVTEQAIRRAIYLSATKYCPVSAMVSAGATEVHHAFRMIATGEAPATAEGVVVVTGPYRSPAVVTD
jgi:putative redox protein